MTALRDRFLDIVDITHPGYSTCLEALSNVYSFAQQVQEPLEKSAAVVFDRHLHWQRSIGWTDLRNPRIRQKDFQDPVWQQRNIRSSLYNALDIDKQFPLGSILVSPVLPDVELIPMLHEKNIPGILCHLDAIRHQHLSDQIEQLNYLKTFDINMFAFQGEIENATKPSDWKLN